MSKDVSRRQFIRKLSTGIGAAGLACMLPWANKAFAAPKTTLIGIQHGGPWIEGAQAVVAKQDKFHIRWDIHTGGSAAVIPKIKVAWPTPLYDMVKQFDPLNFIWRKEGWAEPITYEEMPNLRDIPEEYLFKNEKGEIITIPDNIAAVLFGYRKDIVPFEITTMKDLLDPRLKGQIVVRDATQGLNNNIVMFALAFGGNDRNQEPGWEFMKKLAKLGNIARVAKTEVDFINSLTTGEASVGFWNIGGWGEVMKNFPVELLVRDKSEAPGFQAGLSVENWLIPKNSLRKKEVKEFLNFFISPENNSLYTSYTNGAPSNVKSKPCPVAKAIVFQTKEERKKFLYQFDYEYLSEQKDAMIKRFELEITPIIR